MSCACRAEDGTQKKIQTQQQYKLEKVEAGVATIKVDHPGADAGKRSQAPIANRAALAERHDQFDVDAGRLLHKQMDIDQEVFGFSGAESHMQYLARFTEEPVRRAGDGEGARGTADQCSKAVSGE